MPLLLDIQFFVNGILNIIPIKQRMNIGGRKGHHIRRFCLSQLNIKKVEAISNRDIIKIPNKFDKCISTDISVMLLNLEF
ncbi:hypothetical protein [Clostridium autoethanogenum]|nr:hypothetical protein [Clostridium autoethanogenum]